MQESIRGNACEEKRGKKLRGPGELSDCSAVPASVKNK